MKTAFNTLLILMLSGYAFAGTLNFESEMMMKCRDKAKEYFTTNYETVLYPEDGIGIISEYRSHYNTTLNKCFILTSVLINDDDSKSWHRFITDLNDNTTFGTFAYDVSSKQIDSCNVLDRHCRTQLEFDRLIHPYMTQ